MTAGSAILKSVLAALLLASAAVSAQVYRIGVDEEYPPMSFIEDGRMQGIDVDIMQRAAELEGIEFEFVPMDFDAVIPKLVSGRLDGAIASINITPNRSAIMDFSYVYMATTLTAVVRCSAENEFRHREDFVRKTAALKKGTLGSEFVEHDVKELNFALQYYASTEECAAAVAKGEADFLIEDYPVAVHLQLSREPPELCLSPAHLAPISGFGFAVAKGENQELLSKFNRALHTMQHDGSLDRIFRRYLKADPEDLLH